MPFAPRPDSLAAVPLLLLATAAIFAAPSVAAQEVSASWMRETSDHGEMPEASGGVVGLSVPLSDGWSLAFSLERVESETVKPGLVCRGFGPPVGCSEEDTRTEVTRTGFQARALRTLLSQSRMSARIGAGFSFQQLSVRARGIESGLRGDVLEPTGGQVGAVATLEIGVAPVARLPLRILLGTTAHWVNFDACSDLRRDPFCEPATFVGFRLGVAYRFAARAP